MTLSCDIDGCDFTTDSKVGLGVHKSRSHDLKEFIEVGCKFCNNLFKKKRSEIERTDKHFCSRECHFSWKSENKTGTYNILDCDYCGSKTKVYTSELEKYTHHFCSQQCKDSHHSENYSGENHPRHNIGGVEVNCNTCGETMLRRPSRAKGKTFCNKSCEADYISKRQRGDSNSNWQGGVEKDNYGRNWRQKRKEALKRDNFSCVSCGMSRDEHHQKYGKDLDVHHKIPISEFGEPEDANYMTNLVTTCRSCHASLDKISRREANKEPLIYT